jgi:hypothetical protein
VIDLLVRCYPARWRARYGDEFAALLDERPLGPFDVADVLLGALDAHLHLHGPAAASDAGKGFAMSLRIGGWAAIGAGLLWFLALLGQAAGLAVGGTALLLVALAGLSAFQARRDPFAVWGALAVSAFGGAATLVGVIGLSGGVDRPILWFASSWDVWSLGMVTLAAGSGLFAVASLRTRSLNRAAATLLAVCSLISAITMLLVSTPVGAAIGVREGDAWTLLLVAIGAFATGWIGLGMAVVEAESRSLTAQDGVP